MEYYSTLKKNEIMPFVATWKDLEPIVLSEVSQTVREKHHMISPICRLFFKNIQMNLFAGQKQIHRLKNLWLPKQKVGE